MTYRNLHSPAFDFKEVYPEAGPLEEIDSELGRFYKSHKNEEQSAEGTTFRQSTIEVERRIFSALQHDLEARAILANLIIFADMKNRCAD